MHEPSPPKRALLCVSMASCLVAARLVSRAPGSWWCKHRDRRGVDSENEAMATKQTSKQAKTKAEVRVERSRKNRPIDNSEHEPQHCNRRALSRSGATRTDRAASNAAAVPKASLNGSQVVHDKPRSCFSEIRTSFPPSAIYELFTNLRPSIHKESSARFGADRTEGSGPGDFVKVDCAGCAHTALLAAAFFSVISETPEWMFWAIVGLLVFLMLQRRQRPPSTAASLLHRLRPHLAETEKYG